MNSKLSEKEKALLRRKLLHGGEYAHWTERIAFTNTERTVLDVAERKAERKHRKK